MKITGNRETASLKVLTHSCGCVKGICLSQNKPHKPCDRSCAGCTDHRYTDPCARLQRGYALSRTVTAVEYRA